MKHVATVEAEKTATRVARRASMRDPSFDAMIGARIRALRTARGVSQTVLGSEIGVSFQQVQKYEKGRDRISASMLRSVAIALDVHPGEFFELGAASDGDTNSDGGTTVQVPDEVPMALRELRGIMRAGEAFARIKDPSVRKRAIALVESLTDGPA